jgi:hypothetical protein
MLQLSWFYRAFLRELYEREIRYLLVGGYAVRYYGYARKTRDLDIWIPTDSVNAAKVCELCRGLFDLSDLPVEPFATDWRLVNLTFAPSSAEICRPIIGAKPEVLAQFVGSSMVVEILTIQSGVDFESCYAARVLADLDGVPVSIVSLPHLKLIKGVISERKQDRDDLEHLPGAAQASASR